MTTLFVTAMYDLYNDPRLKKLPDTENWSESWLHIEFRLKHLENLLDCDVDIMLFVQPTIIPFIKSKNSRIKIVPINLTDLTTYNKISSRNLILPKHRNATKDKLEYFSLMNAKIDFMVKAKQYCPDYTHYIWIDGSIFKLFKNVENCQKMITDISKRSLPQNIISPVGDCLPLYPIDPIQIDSVLWRFLGSIFVFPNTTIETFHDLSDFIIDKLISQHRITWEINIWAIVETFYKRSFITYRSNHNDSILFLPSNIDSKEYGELNAIG